MNVSFARVSSIVAVIFGVTFAGQVTADTYTVNNTGDPEVGNPANCSAPANLSLCTLRDALAAADQAADPDTVEFKVKDTIFLNKSLTANHPVTINGNKKTVLRVNQGYIVKILPDRPVFGDTDLPVLQPNYFSVNGTSRALLELHGDGSTVMNMIFDGSITPMLADIGVARIDYESDDVTDFLLYTISDDDGQARWLIAGGIFVSFQGASIPGTVDISDNELRFMNTNAITAEFFRSAVINNNEISHGVAGQIAGAADGVSIFTGGNLSISNNSIADFRTGIQIVFASGVNVLNNDIVGNDQGIFFHLVDASIAPNVIAGNYVADNGNDKANNDTGPGITVVEVQEVAITDNTVVSNGKYGIEVKTATQVSVVGNRVNENGHDPDFEGGIRIAEGAGLNTIVNNNVDFNSGFGIVLDDAPANFVQANSVRKNGGGGIILLNSFLNLSQGNTIESNISDKNSVGILSLSFSGVFPSGNFIRENSMENNTEVDAADFDPACSNLWSVNKFKTAFSTSGSCVQ